VTKRWPQVDVQAFGTSAEAKTAMRCDARLSGTATGVKPDATRAEALRQLRQRAGHHLATCSECKRRST